MNGAGMRLPQLSVCSLEEVRPSQPTVKYSILELVLGDDAIFSTLSAVYRSSYLSFCCHSIVTITPWQQPGLLGPPPSSPSPTSPRLPPPVLRALERHGRNGPSSQLPRLSSGAHTRST